MHPLVLSPNWWTWKPWRPSVKPVSSPVTFTGPLGIRTYFNQKPTIKNIKNISFWPFITNYHQPTTEDKSMNCCPITTHKETLPPTKRQFPPTRSLPALLFKMNCPSHSSVSLQYTDCLHCQFCKCLMLRYATLSLCKIKITISSQINTEMFVLSQMTVSTS